jgi:hypothetical protein
MVAAGIVRGQPTNTPAERTFSGFRESSVPEWDRQFRLVGIHHELKLGRLRVAGIGADAVASVLANES